MSYLYSRALVEEYSGENFLGGGASVPSKLTHTADEFFVIDRTTEPSSRSRFGTTSEPLTANHGEAVLTSFLEGFRVSHIPQQLEGVTRQNVYGLKCLESLPKLNLDTSSQKTSKESQLSEPQRNCDRWVTPHDQHVCQRRTWVQTIYGNDIGYLPTPTTKANQGAKSMMKWPSSRLLVKVFGKVTPENQEWLMGWPIGHTDLKPLETGKFQQWLRQHGEF